MTQTDSFRRMRKSWNHSAIDSTARLVSKLDFSWVAGVGALRNPGIYSTGASLRSSPGHPKKVLKLLLNSGGVFCVIVFPGR